MLFPMFRCRMARNNARARTDGQRTTTTTTTGGDDGRTDRGRRRRWDGHNETDRRAGDDDGNEGTRTGTGWTREGERGRDREGRSPNSRFLILGTGTERHSSTKPFQNDPAALSIASARRTICGNADDDGWHSKTAFVKASAPSDAKLGRAAVIASRQVAQ